MPHLVSTNLFMTTDFILLNGCLIGDTNGLRHLPHYEWKLISLFWEGVATRVYGCHDVSSFAQGGAAECYRKLLTSSSGKRQAVERQVETPTTKNVLVGVEEQLRQEHLLTSFYLLSPNNFCLS